MRFLITGGTGFLGSRVVDRALADGHRVVGLARSDAAATKLRRHGAGTVRGDLDDPATLLPAFREANCEALINIASLGFGHAETIVTAARAAGIRRAVFLSTTGIFTTLDPPSKRIRVAAEGTIAASGLDWTIIRPTMIYGGPDDRNMARLLALLRRVPVLPVPGGGHHLQQPVHVEDLARTVLRATTTAAAIGRAYDVAGPEALTFRQVVITAGAAVGRRVICVPVPVRPVIAVTRAYERRVSSPRLKAEQIARLIEDKAFAIDAARRDLDHRPRPFAAGIAAQATSSPYRVTPSRSPDRTETRMFRIDQATQLLQDLQRIARVAGPPTALRFGAAVARHAPTIRRAGNLDAADRAMAAGGHTYRPLPGVTVMLPGTAFGGAREMYCRGVYHALPGYAPAAGEVVVDLGANQGLFSVLAARAGADVIAVEAQRGFAPAFINHAAGNGVSNHIQLLHALVGPTAGVFADPRARRNATHWDGDVDVLTMAEVFEAGGVDQVDLVKLDIEGSEFALFDEPGWLDAVGRIVMEVHTGFGDPRTLDDLLVRHGFEVTLLGNDLVPTAHLGDAASGYLYARRTRSTTRAIRGSAQPDGRPVSVPGSRPSSEPGFVDDPAPRGVSA
ncbi:FkbM family methyltransferase [Frankia sp. B2]|uniref:FkbM family methyltransferase n=1 Tax=unclassified Frankia TaxID=2632575 RepID=UPI000460EED7|nr:MULTISPECIES: FkbM family methyltransferase [unclassified Frankia]KDA43556.1 nucleoside-diphosphate-sugar epimerase [Frankia sp. BMG5.23]ORT53919.1 methyltransferase FkbM [Frankia sp. KB5]TFE34294.1 FkbM family methyltransferase [Frankia sp. B2]